MARAAFDAINCPRCGGGYALAIFADENGTNRQCFNCDYGFTQPASKDKLEGEPVVSTAVAPGTVAGDPGVGSVQPSGDAFERAQPSAHAEAGPASAPEKKGKD